MNRLQATALFFCLSLATWASAEPPYRAVIKTQEATIRSGPGHEYYATQILEKGDDVQIYRRVNATWCAIRPPATSFSWVLARDVEATDSPDLMRVTSKGAKTRVGTELTESSNVEYVSLREGEIVKVIGSVQRLPGGTKLAYRVEPPAGEFRWIHQRYLKLLDGQTASAETTSEPAGTGVAQASYEDQEDGDDAVPLQKLPRESMATVPIGGDKVETTPNSLARAKRSGSQTYRDATSAARQLKVLSAELSQMVAHPVEEWQLSELHAEIEGIIARSRNLETRKQATKLLNRLAEFDRLQRRHRSLSMAPSRVPQRATPASFETPVQNDSPGMVPWSILPKLAKPAANTKAAPFQGEGWLIPVFTKRRDLPAFALTDDDGAILYFVTPRPGLNLRRYLRKRVGIVGSTIPTGAKEQAQLTAQRIVVLDRHRRY